MGEKIGKLLVAIQGRGQQASKSHERRQQQRLTTQLSHHNTAQQNKSLQNKNM